MLRRVRSSPKVSLWTLHELRYAYTMLCMTEIRRSKLVAIFIFNLLSSCIFCCLFYGLRNWRCLFSVLVNVIRITVFIESIYSIIHLVAAVVCAVVILLFKDFYKQNFAFLIIGGYLWCNNRGMVSNNHITFFISPSFTAFWTYLIIMVLSWKVTSLFVVIL